MDSTHTSCSTQLKLTFAGLLLCSMLPGCQQQDSLQQHGYIEARLLFLSAPVAGKLISINDTRGAAVNPGDVLLTLDSQPERADMTAAAAAMRQALANLRNLHKGRRDAALKAIEAEIKQRRAELLFAQKELSRHQKLRTKKHIGQDILDTSLRNINTTKAKLQQLAANLSYAKLPARIDIIHAAEAALAVSQAQLEKARWYHQQKTLKSPTRALIYDTFYQRGEQVPANHPILALLPSTNIKAVFFIPQFALSQLHLGERINIHCDQCPSHITATISFISPQAEYTPPIIYSQHTRNKLVYRVEARLTEQYRDQLHPGQPIDIIFTHSLKKQ